jgi:hypothetical protein
MRFQSLIRAATVTDHSSSLESTPEPDQLVYTVLSWQVLAHAFALARTCTGTQFHDWVLKITFVG